MLSTATKPRPDNSVGPLVFKAIREADAGAPGTGVLENRHSLPPRRAEPPPMLSLQNGRLKRGCNGTAGQRIDGRGRGYVRELEPEGEQTHHA